MPTFAIATTLIPVAHIRANPDQPRKSFDAVELAALKASILQRGLINPIAVVMKGEGEYVLIAGERRWRAAQELGWSEIDARVWPQGTPADEIELLALVENLQRKDLNAVEVAMAYQVLIDRFGKTQQEVAKQVGISQPVVARALSLLALPVEILDFMSRDIISEKHVRYLKRISDPELFKATALQAGREGWSTAETQRRVSEMTGSASPPVPTHPLADLPEPGFEMKSATVNSEGKIDLEWTLLPTAYAYQVLITFLANGAYHAVTPFQAVTGPTHRLNPTESVYSEAWIAIKALTPTRTDPMTKPVYIKWR